MILRGQLNGAYERVYVINAVLDEIVFDAGDDAFEDGGVVEDGGTDLDGSGADDEVFYRVLRAANAAHADDGNLHCFCNCIYHSHTDGFNRRSG